MADELAPFAAYDAMLSRCCMDALADVVVIRSDGSRFLAIKKVADHEVFDRAGVAADETIRYVAADASDIAPGELVSIGGERFEIYGDPLQINAHEFRAQIVRVT